VSEALARLARSRQALANQLIKPEKERSRQERAAGEAHDDDEPHQPYRDASEPVSGWWGTIRHAARVWWRYHPARAAADLARPAVENYARKNPATLLAVAAVAGAALVVARPWRLVSMTGLLVAALRPTELSAVVLSLLSVGGKDDDEGDGR
jgi:hypothetical protein